jgi:hypothetical protein
MIGAELGARPAMPRRPKFPLDCLVTAAISPLTSCLPSVPSKSYCTPPLSAKLPACCRETVGRPFFLTSLVLLCVLLVSLLAALRRPAVPWRVPTPAAAAAVAVRTVLSQLPVIIFKTREPAHIRSKACHVLTHV